MDILIKGMEMPSCCGNCQFNQFYDAKHWTTWNFCMFLNKDTDSIGNGRLADCPLVALPEHGRLGDLDLVEEWMRKKHKEHDCPFDIDAFLFALRKFPTIVEANNGSDN